MALISDAGVAQPGQRRRWYRAIFLCALPARLRIIAENPRKFSAFWQSSCPLGVRGFKSHLPHHTDFSNGNRDVLPTNASDCKLLFTSPDDWDEFRNWLTPQFGSKEYVRNIVFKAKEWYRAIYDAKELAKLRAVSPATRSRILKALANRAKFEGACETWQSTIKNARE
jgi:hypothetical protein